MTPSLMNGCLCLFSFDFQDPNYLQLSEDLLNTSPGVSEEQMFEYAFSILSDLTSIYDILDHLDNIVFPEHVPNECVRYCSDLCFNFIVYLTHALFKYKTNISLLISTINQITLVHKTQTIEMIVNA